MKTERTKRPSTETYQSSFTVASRSPRHSREEKHVHAVTKFRLLMWKNFLQQKRHRSQTITELLLPVVTMTFVLILRWQIEPQILGTVRYPYFDAISLKFARMVLGGLNLTQMTFAYSPQNVLLEDIVGTATKRLIMNNFNLFSSAILQILPQLSSDTKIPEKIDAQSPLIHDIVKKFIKVKGYRNSQLLRGIYIEEKITRVVVAAIEFEDHLYGENELPKVLQYSLRFPERPRLNSFYGDGGRTWKTDSVFPIFEQPGPRFPFSWEGGNDPGYVNELFTQLQHCVSMELISRLSGRDMTKFDVIINRYPHPPFTFDHALEVMKFLLPMLIMLSFSYTAVNIVRAVTVEKELQLKETMKIMGLPTWLHWAAWFCKQFLYLQLSTLLIVIILKVQWFTSKEGFHDYAVFTQTPWTVLFFYITLYLTCTIFFCFMLSGFFSKASTAALFAGVIWFLTYTPAFLLGMDVSMSAAVQAITCLSLNSAMSYGFQLLLARENTGGMRWGEFLFSPASNVTRFVFGHVIMMLIFNCILYMLLALYLEQVLPGPYGTPQPWNFFLSTEYWSSKGSEPRTERVVEDDDDDDDQDVDEQEIIDQYKVIKERDPTDLTVGVQISNVFKKYGYNVVVNNLSLNIYNDQITVLLGHNGAGKSTTISMLTGNLAPSRGSIWVTGYDMRTQSRHARAHIGLCPQHNVLFNELTVKEHLEFFARLKGFSGYEMEEEICLLIEKLELNDKRDYEAHGLSGGQKRRLSVGIALSGGSRVVLLDEPTSGMDPASRRSLWELLQQEKIGRSMILTTHFMDEADILGDRVAILAHGRLQCVGSPYFLKRHYGVGYMLVVVKDEDFDADACTDLINEYIPDIAIKEDRGLEITYSLTNEYSSVFQDMLNNLEQNKERIKFKNYGLVATTMEDVFMSVGSEAAYLSNEDAALETTEEFESSLEQLNNDGAYESDRIWRRHVRANWQKLWLVWTRSWTLLALQVSVPILVINATLGVMQYILTLTETIQRRKLTLEEGYTGTETLLSFNGTDTSSLGYLAKAAYEDIFTKSKISTMSITIVNGQLIDEYYLNKANETKMISMRNRLLTGATFMDNAAIAWFSNFGYHDLATSLATIHSALLKATVPDAKLTVYNHPLNANYMDQSDKQFLLSMLTIQFSFGMGTSLGIVSAVFIMFYIKERICRAKLLQKAASIRPITMWPSAAVFDFAWFLIICIPILISCISFQVIGFSTFAEIGRLYFLLMIYGLAMLPINYVFSNYFNTPAIGFVIMFFVNVLLGMMGAQTVQALRSAKLRTKKAADTIDAILQFFPLYSLVTAVRSLNTIALNEWSCTQSCDYLLALMPEIVECNMKVLCEYFSQRCCIRKNSYFDWKEPGVMRYIICMLFTGAVMWLILMAVEYRLINKIKYFNRERRPPPIDESTLDEDVAKEAKYVKSLKKAAISKHSLVAKRLSKYYKNYLAVDQVSFTVGGTECFGLLGVNGAGKTTTFKMLMGDEAISSGNAYVSGHSVKTDITKVHEKIGYCPQFDAVFEELTGRETLKFFCMLRGIKPETIHNMTESLAHALDFYKHLDKRVYQYSGGNIRKLSTAVALLGRSRLIFVDEPTTGVDPAAKRKVWKAVQGARRVGRGVVLTSHSMEECEALCSRLTIMVNGRFQCLGTPQHLKNKFSEGFTLTIKMKMDEEKKVSKDRIVSNLLATEAIKKYIITNFNHPKIMEEYQGLLTYYLPDRSVPWADMFGIMERAKLELEIEDYSISQTTLEQIFLQFTKYQQEVS